MSQDLSGTKVTEITINTRRLIHGVRVNRKAAGAVKKLRKFIRQQWHTELPIYISEDLNKMIWSRGNSGTVGRIRIRVERGPCMVNPEEKCIRLSLVDVNTFKNLQDMAVNE